jgi:hypothetical protein
MTEQSNPKSTESAPKFNMGFINVLASMLAVFVSLLSLWLALSANRTQERMLAASSWPFLRFGHANADDDGAPVIRLTVRNGGNGPAVLRWLRFSDGANALVDVETILAWVAPNVKGLTVWSSTSTDVALSPGQELQVLQFHQTDTNKAAFDAFNVARWKIKVEGCYCSVIGDCWTFTNQGLPTPQAQCPAPPSGSWRFSGDQ